MKVLKIGGSLITRKDSYRQPDAPNIAKLAKAVAALWKKGIRDFVLVHGAGSFGHALVLRYGINDGVKTEAQKLGYADTHAACSELSVLFVKALVDEEVPAVSLAPALLITQKNRRISRFNEAPLEECLKNGYLPVLYGDMVPDSVLGASICSGDQIVAHLGKKADFIVLATNVDGVLDGKGAVISEITTANFVDVSKGLKRVENDVTGAMEGKLKELLALDTVSYIVNGEHPERLEALMSGKVEVVCTEVKKRIL
jgi:isopentenyl phosphate kinase